MTGFEVVFMLVVHCEASGVGLTLPGLEDWAHLGTVRVHQFSEQFDLCIKRWKNCTVSGTGWTVATEEGNQQLRAASACSTMDSLRAFGGPVLIIYAPVVWAE